MSDGESDKGADPQVGNDDKLTTGALAAGTATRRDEEGAPWHVDTRGPPSRGVLFTGIWINVQDSEETLRSHESCAKGTRHVGLTTLGASRDTDGTLPFHMCVVGCGTGLARATIRSTRAPACLRTLIASTLEASVMSSPFTLRS